MSPKNEGLEIFAPEMSLNLSHITQGTPSKLTIRVRSMFCGIPHLPRFNALALAWCERARRVQCQLKCPRRLTEALNFEVRHQNHEQLQKQL
ncbi:hypothetical protein TNCV_3105031 [Trichonephila clavipes]|nr:hypothetical protein TNCV_3105031 [Trichonephila clavipes]